MNYLCVVKGTVSLVLEDESAPIAVQTALMLRTALEAVDLRAKLLVELSELLRVGSSADGKPDEYCDLIAMAREARAEIEAASKQSHVPIQIEATAAVPAVFVCRQRVTRAFRKLLDYCVEVMIPRSVVAFDARQIGDASSRLGPGAAVECTFRFISKVKTDETALDLDRFEQARLWKVTRQKSLGLTLARPLIETQGGRVRVESVPPSTAIILELPL